MAFVRKRAGKWYVRFVDGSGEPVERVTLATSKTEAARIGLDLERRAERVRLGLDTELVEMTLTDLWTRYEPVARGMRGFKSAEGRWRLHIKPALGSRLLHTIRPGDIKQLLAEKQTKPQASPKRKTAKPLSAQSAEHIRVLLSSLYTYATDDLKIFRGDNPAREVGKLKVPERPPKYLTEEQVELLLKCVPDRWRGLFAFAVFTGLRAGELRGLRVTDVDLARRLIIVWFTASGGTTKSGKFRFVPIPEALVPYAKLELGRARSSWLFSRKDGSPLTKDLPLPEMLRRALVKAGFVQGFDHLCVTRGKKKGCGLIERRADGARIRCPKCNAISWVKPVPLDVAFKDLRSTFGTHFAEHTGDLRLVQRALGHADLEVTEKRYAFARDRHFRNQAKDFSYSGSSARSLPSSEGESEQRQANSGEVIALDRASNHR
jgi:integrase